MRYFINLTNTSRKDREKSNGEYKVYWEVDSKEKGLEIKNNILKNFKQYDYTTAQESQEADSHTLFDLLGIENINDTSYEVLYQFNYRVEAFDEIYDYLNQEIGEDKINVELK